MLSHQALSSQRRKELETEAARLIKVAKRRFGSGACSADLLNQIKEIFQVLRPWVSQELVLYLAQQQAEHAPHFRLFEKSEENVAVWAQARAYGWTSRLRPSGYKLSADSIEDLPEDLQPYASRLTPVLAPPLDWGATSHLQDRLVAAVDSPIIHAWLYQDEKQSVTDAVIIGRGIPEIRAEVTAAALSCFFALEPKLNDFAVNGVIRLAAAEMESEATGEGRRGPMLTIFQQLLIPFRGNPKSEITIPQSAQEAMILLQGALQRLEEETGFVRVHLVPEQKAKELRENLAKYNRLAGKGDAAYLWCGDSSHADHDSVATTLTYDRLPRLPRGILRLELHSELLETPAYRELADKFYHALVTDIVEDARRRESFYADMLQEHTQSREWYKQLSEPEKQALPDVWVDSEIHYATGTIIRLPEPQRVSAQVYYTTSMDYKITEDSKWLEMMKRLRQRIDHILHHEAAPLERMIAARLFDAALRDVTPTDDRAVQNLFDAWKRQIQPLLWLEWRDLLEDESINAQDVCTRHTVFNLGLNRGDRTISLIPHSVFDSLHSVVLFDRQRGVQVVYDATDYAVQKTDVATDPAIADARYKEAQELAERGSPTQQIRVQLWAALAANPRSVAERITGEWLTSWPDEDGVKFDELTKAALWKGYPQLAALCALRWMNEHCFASADEVLKKAEDMAQKSSQKHAAVLLMRAQLEGIRSEYGVNLREMVDWVEKKRGRIAQADLEHVVALIRQAMQLNKQLVKAYVESNLLAPGSYAQDSLTATSLEEDGILNVLAAIEAANAAARVEDATTGLDALYESRRTAYAKLAPAIEQCTALEFTSLRDSEGVNELLTLLTGERRSRTA